MLQTGEDDRPSEPPVFLDAEVLWNPFEDLVPRITKEERLAEEAARRSACCPHSRPCTPDQARDGGTPRLGKQGREKGGDVNNVEGLACTCCCCCLQGARNGRAETR